MKNFKKYEITLNDNTNIDWLFVLKNVQDLVFCKYTNTAQFKCDDILTLIKKLNNIN